MLVRLSLATVAASVTMLLAWQRSGSLAVPTLLIFFVCCWAFSEVVTFAIRRWVSQLGRTFEQIED